MIYLFHDKETEAPVYIVKHGISDEGCDKIIKELKDQTQVATHQMNEKMVTSTDGPRNSSVSWFQDEPLRQVLWQWVQVANYQAGWRYDIKDSEIFQFTKYEGKKKQHYNWHTDGPGCHHAVRNFVYTAAKNIREIQQANLAGTVRKLSLSAVLNDDYEGGEFEVYHLKSNVWTTSTIKPEKGSVLIFPSYLQHRVKPVTKGDRYSVVAWYGGPPFK